ncbi:MAG: EF-P beta-lysylation protein EpmB [Gammaproteobacteria bacterium]|nr:EF-P beta-lysylation protein EpmB [Gammaproteobacteria bacterium]
MITRSIPTWQAELAAAIRNPLELLAELELPADAPGVKLLDASIQFPLRVPRSFVRRMRKADPQDPLLRQVLPLDDEQRAVPDYGTDPVGDLLAMRGAGVLHKYPGRVLLVTTGACAVHCRYCFRRHFPYGRARAQEDEWRQALDYIARDEGIREVILSGGDPLCLVDEKLAPLATRLAALKHVQRLRIHTRLPIVLPSRVNTALLSWLTATRLRVVVVVHVNHPNELDDEVGTALARFAAHGLTLLNQAVLLREVNNNVDTLAALSESLFSAGVLPYYLHQLDRVYGAAHFAVEDGEAVGLVEALRKRLPGYLVPRLVKEVPGKASKVPLLA